MRAIWNSNLPVSPSSNYSNNCQKIKTQKFSKKHRSQNNWINKCKALTLQTWNGTCLSPRMFLWWRYQIKSKMTLWLIPLLKIRLKIYATKINSNILASKKSSKTNSKLNHIMEVVQTEKLRMKVHQNCSKPSLWKEPTKMNLKSTTHMLRPKESTTLMSLQLRSTSKIWRSTSSSCM